MSLPKRVAVSAGVLAIALGAAIGLSAQPIPPGDHLTGTWILNVPQSKYVPADMQSVARLHLAGRPKMAPDEEHRWLSLTADLGRQLSECAPGERAASRARGSRSA